MEAEAYNGSDESDSAAEARMILDTLAKAGRYAAMHAGFARAFEFLATTDLAGLAPGRREIDGDRMYVSIVQYTIDGDELIGWMPLARGTSPDGAFDESKDIGFFADRPTTWISVPAGGFTIFFPHDAHASLAGLGRLRTSTMWRTGL